MRSLLFVIFLVLAGCNSPTKPSEVIPPPLPVSGGPSHTVVQVTTVRPNEYSVALWGNLKLRLERQPAAGDSLSGGQIVIRDYSCGSRSSFRTGYANAAPRENSDTTLFTSITTCGSPQLEVWVETFYVGRGQETPIRHTLVPPTELRNSPGFALRNGMIVAQ